MREIARSEDLPLKKSSLQKIFGSNLTLCAREARGTPKPHWFSLVRGKENQCENNLVSTVVGVEGVEPSRLAAYDFESYAYTNSATRPLFFVLYNKDLINLPTIAIYAHLFQDYLAAPVSFFEAAGSYNINLLAVKNQFLYKIQM